MTTLSRIHYLLRAQTAQKNFTGSGTLRYRRPIGFDCFDYSPPDTDPHQWGFSGISTFAHLKHVKCLSERDKPLSVDVKYAVRGCALH